MLVVRSDTHQAHHCLELDGTRLISSWESPDRADHVDRAVDAAGRHHVIQPDAFPRNVVDRVHDPDYVDFLRSAWPRWVSEGNDAPAAMAFGWPARRFRDVRPVHLEAQLGYYSFAADCSIAEGTWAAVEASAAIAITAATAVATDTPVAFARCRPPGHHAMRDQFGGYCYLNNAAISAQALRDAGHSRVALLDVDYHHGNGTQDIFYDRNDVRVCNIHADPREEFPYFLGHADELGAGKGEGHNRNIPLPRGTTAEPWFAALDAGIDWVTGNQPSALVVSLGLDTFEDDPISHFALQRHDFVELGRRLAALGLPSVLVLEGGYATAALGDNVVAVLDGFEAVS
ncbi:MAG: histone deacetylase family protein [Actinomycetota bacterium]